MASKQPRTFAAVAAKNEKEIESQLTNAALQRTEVALMNASHVYFNRGYIAYNPSMLITRKGMKILDEMRCDEQLKNAIEFKRAAILGTGWEVVPPEGADEDHEPTRFVRYVLGKHLQGNLKRSLREVMTSVIYGFSVTEKMFNVIEGGEFSGKIGLHMLKTKKPHHFEFVQDEYGNIEPDGVVQVQGGTRKRLPVGKFFIHTHNGEFGNIYGRTDLESAYQAWWAKSNSYSWLAMLLERLGIPPIVAKYNSDVMRGEQVDELVSMLQSFRNSGGIAAIPNPGNEAVDFWTPELAGQAVSVFIPAINAFNQDMARALNAPGLIGITPESGDAGSRARAETHFDSYMLMLNELREDLEDNVNDDFVRQLVLLNYGNIEDLPRWKLSPYDDGFRGELFDKWLSAIDKGIVEPQRSDEDHIRKAMKMPDREEERLPLRMASSFETAIKLIRSGLLSRELVARMFEIDIEEIDNAVKADRDRAEELELVYDTNASRTTQAGLSPTALTQGTPEPVPGFPAKPEDAGDTDDDDSAPVNFADFTKKIVKFADIDRNLNAIEEASQGEIVEGVAASRDALISVARKQWDKKGGPDADFINKMTLRRWGAVTSSIEEMSRVSYALGREDFRDELTRAVPNKKFQADATKAKFIPRAAIEFLKARAKSSSLILRDRLHREASNALAKSMENGETTQQMIGRLQGVFDPYVGKPDVLRDGAELKPWQIENIVRTNTTAAYNHGRIIESRRPDTERFLVGMRYSATLDSRTTEVCSFLDGKVFRPEDGSLDDLTPPNHYQCRSILVPVPVGVQFDESDFVTNAQAGRGKDLAGVGFV